MVDDAEAFFILVEKILRRFGAQNGQTELFSSAARHYARRLLDLVGERGLPRPLRQSELGEPGELPEKECADLLARIMAGATAEEVELWAVPLRQLVKACFHAEFKVCRDSFKEASADGICRRQQLHRARERVSGAHCIDCPYWVALTPEQHARFLEREWQPAGREELKEQRGIFLPEDFRALRLWLYARARVSI